MKICNRCNEEKSLDAFGKRKDTKDGRKYYCIACGRKLAAEQRARNPEKESARQKRYYANNKQAQITKAAKWTKKNSERVNKHRRDTGIGAASRAKYRTAKLQQTPQWANLSAIRRIYSACARVTKETGVPHEVDHIIPVQGEKVRGLHVAHNLQIIPALDIKSKGNR